MLGQCFLCVYMSVVVDCKKEHGHGQGEREEEREALCREVFSGTRVRVISLIMLVARGDLESPNPFD